VTSEIEGPVDEFGMPVLGAVKEDEEEQAEQAPDYSAPPTLSRLEWTAVRGGGAEYPCWVEFRDPMDLSGADIRKLRKAGGNAGDNRGEIYNQAMNAGLTLLVTAWDIGYLPNFPVPGATRNPAAILEQLGGFDLKRIEQHVEPVVSHILRGRRTGGQGNEGSGPGSPPTPARG
jgi:hypothetical protein